jgi:hypothetical protein
LIALILADSSQRQAHFSKYSRGKQELMNGDSLWSADARSRFGSLFTDPGIRAPKAVAVSQQALQ